MRVTCDVRRTRDSMTLSQCHQSSFHRFYQCFSWRDPDKREPLGYKLLVEPHQLDSYGCGGGLTCGRRVFYGGQYLRQLGPLFQHSPPQNWSFLLLRMKGLERTGTGQEDCIISHNNQRSDFPVFTGLCHKSGSSRYSPPRCLLPFPVIEGRLDFHVDTIIFRNQFPAGQVRLIIIFVFPRYETLEILCLTMARGWVESWNIELCLLQPT